MLTDDQKPVQKIDTELTMLMQHRQKQIGVAAHLASVVAGYTGGADLGVASSSREKLQTLKETSRVSGRLTKFDEINFEHLV